MAQSLYEIIEDCKDELRENFGSYEYPEDLVHELADSAVPLYNSQLLELAAADPSLAEEGEFGPASALTPPNLPQTQREGVAG